MTRERNLKAAANLLLKFSGHKADRVYKIKKPRIPGELLAVGHVTGIMYRTVRDGREVNLLHEFSRTAQPLLAASHDGRSVLLLGGSYNFTARGIVDRRKRRKS